MLSAASVRAASLLFLVLLSLLQLLNSFTYCAYSAVQDAYWQLNLSDEAISFRGQSYRFPCIHV
jgi:hypothetical protein